MTLKEIFKGHEELNNFELFSNTNASAVLFIYSLESDERERSLDYESFCK